MKSKDMDALNKLPPVDTVDGGSLTGPGHQGKRYRQPTAEGESVFLRDEPPTSCPIPRGHP